MGTTGQEGAESTGLLTIMAGRAGNHDGPAPSKKLFMGDVLLNLPHSEGGAS